MKQLVLRNTLYERIYRSLGIVFLVMIIVILLTGDKDKWWFWLLTVSFLLMGLLFISLNFGTLINRITAENGKLIIRWSDKLARVTVRIDDIEEILADTYAVQIILKSGRKVRLPTRMLEFEEKRAVRKFLKETTSF